MFFKRNSREKACKRVAENIKKDLIWTFQRKGIKIAKINVDLKYDNFNLEVLIDGN